jgi:hypothetical protein
MTLWTSSIGHTCARWAIWSCCSLNAPNLLGLVAELCGGGDDAELAGVRLLKDEKAKDRIIELVRGLGLSGLDELVGGVENYWSDKEARNRLIHDDWFPSLEEDGLGRVGTRGLTRKKVPEEIIDWRSVDEVWGLAHRFREYSGLFSHRAWELSRSRNPDSLPNDRPIEPTP